MENSIVHTKEKNQKNDEKPPPRVCPRCNSGNTKFCYYNNYRSSQPRYFCKSCRRYWTHGGAMRKIPIGGSSHKRRTNISQPSASQVFSVNFQHQVHYHQPFFHIQANNENLISFDTSSSSVAATIGNHSNSLSMIHNEPLRFPPPIKDVLDFSKGSFQEDIFNTGSNHWSGNPLINQVIGRQVYNQNDYRMNQEDPNKWNQNFKSTINMSNIASTSGITRSSVMKKCIFGSFYHLKKQSL